MRIRVSVIWVLLFSVLLTSGLRAQSVVDTSAMRQAMAQQQSLDEANQRVVLRVLARNEVRDIAQGLGLDVKDAEHAIRQLSSAQLSQLAMSARAVEVDLAGGQNVTITISVVALLLIILIIVLIAD